MVSPVCSWAAWWPGASRRPARPPGPTPPTRPTRWRRAWPRATSRASVHRGDRGRRGGAQADRGRGHGRDRAARSRPPRSATTAATARRRATIGWTVAARRAGLDLHQPRPRCGCVDDEWQVVWQPDARRAVADGRRGARRAARRPPSAATSLGARGVHLVTERPVVRFGHRPQPGAEGAGRPSRPASWRSCSASTPRRTSSGSRRPATASSSRRITYRRDQVPRGRGRRSTRTSTAPSPSAPTCRSRRPRSSRRRSSARVGEVTAEMIEDDPERYRVGDVAGLSGLAGAVRRAARAARPASWSTRWAATARSASSSARTPTAGEPLRLTLDQDLQLAAEDLLADVRPGQRAGGAAALDRRRARRRQRPGQRRLQHGDLRAVRAGLDVQEREQPGPAARRADPRRRPVPCTPTITVDGKRFENYDDYPAAGLGPDPAAHRGRQLVQHRLHQPGRQGRATATSPTPPPRSASGSTTTSASRRTSARCRRRSPRPRRPPT